MSVPHQYSGILHVSSQSVYPHTRHLFATFRFFTLTYTKISGDWMGPGVYTDLQQFENIWNRFLWEVVVYVCVYMYVVTQRILEDFFCPYVVFALTISYQLSLLCDENFIFLLSKPDLFGWPGI